MRCSPDWFDADAVRAVVTDDIVAGWDAIDTLDGLVRKSLVVAAQQENGVTRFQMLETLRQYPRDRLDEHDDMDMWRCRHAEYYAVLGEQIRDGPRGPDEFA